MALETFSYISSLNASNPDGADNLSDGDAHLRGVKTVLLASFPEIAGVVSASHGELNWTVGVTSAIQDQLNAKSPTASPTFTGTVTLPLGVVTTYMTAPTEAAGSNNTRLATTEFVQTAFADATGGVSRGRMYFYANF